MKKRITALLLVLVMLLGTLPTVALAADNSVCVVKNAATSAITDGIVLDDDKSEPVYFQLLGMDEGAAPIAFQDGNFQTFAKFEDPYVNQIRGDGEWYYDKDESSDTITVPVEELTPVRKTVCWKGLKTKCKADGAEEALKKTFEQIEETATIYLLSLNYYQVDKDADYTIYYLFVVGASFAEKPQTYKIEAGSDERVSFALDGNASVQGAASVSYTETESKQGVRLDSPVTVTDIACTDGDYVLNGWSAAYQGQTQTQSGAGTLTFGADAERLTLVFADNSISISGLLKGNLTLKPLLARKPVEIGTADELMKFAEQVNGGEQDRGAVLTGNIDLTGKTWVSIGSTTSKAYRGTFDGAGYTISGLTEATGSNRALFGNLGSGAVVKKLTVAGKLELADSKGGGIAAYARLDQEGGTILLQNCTNKVTLTSGAETALGGVISVVSAAKSGTGTLRMENCKNEASVTSTSTYAGGIVGDLGTAGPGIKLILSGCENSAAVRGKTEAGGLAAFADLRGGALTVSECQNSGSVSGGGNVGGLLGKISIGNQSAASAARIERSGNSGSVHADGSCAGGVVGFYNGNTCTGATAVMDQCYNLGTVAGENSAGGLCGSFSSDYGEIMSCYSTGSVSGGEEVGGLCGMFGFYTTKKNGNATLKDSYAAPEKLTGPAASTGLLVGKTQNGIYENCHYAVLEGFRDIAKLDYAPAKRNTAAADENLLEKLGSAFAADGANINRGYPVLSFQKLSASVTLTALEVDVSDAEVLLYAPGHFTLNTNGLRFTAVYSDNSRRSIPATAVTFDASAVQADKVGEYPVKVLYDGVEGSFLVTISDDVPAPISEAEATGEYKGMTGYYRLENLKQLLWFADYIERADAAANAVLANDIDVSGACSETLGSWTPLGAVKAYSGTLNGNGHSIRNLYWNVPADSNQRTGFIGTLSGTVKNLTVTGTLHSAAVGAESYAGGIAGYAEAGAHMESCVSAVVIDASGSVCAGSIAGGVNGAYLKDCVNSAEITASRAGGIAGKLLAVSAAADAEPALQNCRNTGAINSDGTLAGGIVAEAGGSLLQITGCVNTGAVTLDTSTASGVCAGGIAALVTVPSSSGSHFALTDCSNTGSVKLHSKTASIGNYVYAGGLVGSMDEAASVSIQRCTNGGMVTLDKKSAQRSFAGGIAGHYAGGRLLMIDCGNAADISGYGSIGGLMGYFKGSDDTGKDNAAQLLQKNGPYILRCASTGRVTAKAAEKEIAQYCGGLVGEMYRNADGGIRVEDSYHIGTVSTEGQYAGGLFGCLPKSSENTALILNGCYTIGAVSSSAEGGAAGQIAGYAMDDTAASIENVYYEARSGAAAIGTGKTALVFREMQPGQAISRTGLGFVAESHTGAAVLPWQLGLTDEMLKSASSLALDTAAMETQVYPLNCDIAKELDTNGIFASAVLNEKTYFVGHKLLTADVSAVDTTKDGGYTVRLTLGSGSDSFDIQVGSVRYQIGFSAADAETKQTVQAAVTLEQGGTVVEPQQDGTYLLAPGTYSYTVSAAHYRTQTGELTVGITDTDRTVTVELTRTYEVRFVVKNESGETIENPSITAKNAKETFTAENGVLELPSGEYTYTIRADGYTSIRDVALSVGKETQTIEQTMVIWDSKVYFSLWGDTLHGGGQEHHLYDGTMTEWIPLIEVPIEEDWTVRDVMEAVLPKYYYEISNPSGSYVDKITTPDGEGLSEKANGQYSGWMYMVNEGFAGVGVDAWRVQDGDVVTFYYVDNFKTEGTISVTAPTKRTYFIEDSAAELDTSGLKVEFTVNPMDGGSGKRSDVTKNAQIFLLNNAQFDSTTPGEQRVFVRYGGYTGSFVVEVRYKNAEELHQTLSECISRAEALDEAEYGKASWSALQTELQTAKEAHAHADASEQALRDALLALRNALAALRPAVEEVTAQIEAIGTVTLQSGDKIAAARRAYEELCPEQKALVSAETIKILTDAEDAYAALVDQDAAKRVEDLIDAIGRVTPGSGSKIAAARAAYDALTPSQKKLVGNYQTLLDAEKRYEDLKKPITPVGPSTPSKPSQNENAGKDNLPFTDVISGSWYYDGVKYACDNGLMNGTSANAFSPNADTTRSMIVTILARMEGVNTSGGATWYTAGRAWAMENGISDGTNMEGKITREQLAAMLYRYAKLKGYDVSASADISGYTDASGVSGWAKEAMQWAVGSGLIQGSGNALTPQANASRAQIATILMRFAQSIAK